MIGKVIVLFYCLLSTTCLMAQEYRYDYIFFRNSNTDSSYFYSNAAATGNAFVNSVDGKLPVSNLFFHTAGNALQLQYINAAESKWTATVTHHKLRGQDYFKEATYFSCWVYVATEITTSSELPVVQFMRADSTLTTAFPITVTQSGKWQRILIPVAALETTAGFNTMAANPAVLTAVIFSQQSATGRHSIYIDDIEFLPAAASASIETVPIIIAAKGYAKHVDIAWQEPQDSSIHLINIYRSTNGKDYTNIGVQYPYISRYADYTGETGKRYFYKIAYVNSNFDETVSSPSVTASTRKMTDEELLTMVQEACFRYYWEAAEKHSGLAKENIHGRQNMIASGASGFGMLALIAGTERKFITKKESVQRFVQMLHFLEKAETFHGAYPHFIDGPTGKAEPFFGNRDNGADLVETSFLLQGLLAAKQYFTGKDTAETYIRNAVNRIWRKVEWNWFNQYPQSKFLYWHWSPDQAWVINHNLIGWNETMITYLLAIASPTHAVPASMYYTGWANTDSTGQEYRKAWGQTADGSRYSNGKTYYGVKLYVGVSNGGPLFFTHYSFMGYDPHAITDRYTNYFINNKNIATINHRYCVDNPLRFRGYGDSAWGLTASDGPYSYSADEPVSWQDHGKITPTGAIASFPYLPKEAMKALKNYYFNYGKMLWGEYGFKDSFSPELNWCSEIYMGLNQAPMTVMIENYRSGLLWKLFMSEPEIKAGLQKLAVETKRH